MRLVGQNLNLVCKTQIQNNRLKNSMNVTKTFVALVKMFKNPNVSTVSTVFLRVK